MVKLNASGTIVWDKTIGGSGNELYGNIVQTNDGGYIIGGASTSGISGDKTIASFGSNDGWIIKLNSSGTIVWQKGYGGSGQDNIFSIEKLSNNTYVLIGFSDSPISGNKTIGTNGLGDFWLLIIDENGNILNQYGYGGTQVDGGLDVVETVDGDLVLVGNSLSGIGGDKTEASRGDYDSWVIKLKRGKFLDAGECMTVQYTYDVSGVSAGNYDFSFDVDATKTLASDNTPLILPNTNFSVGANTGLNGFDGSSNTTDDITIAPSSACPSGDLLAIAVDIPGNSVCENGFTTATVAITNSTGGAFNNINLALNLTGTSTIYTSEPYDFNGLTLPSANANNAISGSSGLDTLSIYNLPNGTSTFKIDLGIGTGLANLSAQLIDIPSGYNATNESNIGIDATGITGFSNPVISGVCPSAITLPTTTISLAYTITNASAITWLSGTNGSFSAPSSGTTNYTINSEDIANGFVDFSIRAVNANNCETMALCRVEINNVNYDYGDAPSSYDFNENVVPTAGAATILSGFYLGTIAPDTETTKVASVNGTGDGADEDAMNNVIIYKPTSGTQGFTIPVKTTNNSNSTGYIRAYIDWNNDGDFLDTLEESTEITIPANSGLATYNPSFNVPNITIPDDVFLRLRASTSSIRRSFGVVPEGEVEDVLMPLIMCVDTDGDGICNSDDIDDDNDGIRDVDECTSVAGANASSVFFEQSVGGVGANAAIGSDNSRAALNAVGDTLVLDLGLDVASGTIIEIEARVTNSIGNTMEVEESPDGSTFSNLQSYTWASTSTEETKQYTLTSTSRYIRITLGIDGGSGALQVDNVAYQGFLFCSDTDMDGTADHLDLDSDGDGCYDKVEAGVTGFTQNGSITDSLAASTAAEVGANGLDDDIENNDTQTATTSDSYTIIQTNSGINDFQDATIRVACTEICNDNMDNDGDGFIDCADSDCKPIISNVSFTQPTCSNKTSGQITIGATSSGILSYSITNERFWQSSNTFSNLGIGQYTIRVRNDSGCETEYIPNPILLDFDTCVEICNDGIDNDGDGKIDCDDTDCQNIGAATINN